MDDREAVWAAKLENLLKQAAEVSMGLNRDNGTISGVPHYSVIEGRAHDLGRQLGHANALKRTSGEIAFVAMSCSSLKLWQSSQPESSAVAYPPH